MGYLDLAGFRARTVMPPEDVDRLQLRRPGWIGHRLDRWSSVIDVQSRKRYAAPFAAPYPDVVLGWLDALVTLEAYQALGWAPSTEQDAQIVSAHDAAVADLKELADSEVGLFDLPLRQDTAESGIVNGGPFFYAEASPFDWMDQQREAIRGR